MGYGSFYLEVEKGNIWYNIPINGIKEVRRNLPVNYKITHEIFLDQSLPRNIPRTMEPL